MDLRTAYMVTDVFDGIGQMAVACAGQGDRQKTVSGSSYEAGTERMHEGKLEMLKNLVSESEYRDLVDFWREEYVVD